MKDLSILEAELAQKVSVYKSVLQDDCPLPADFKELVPKVDNYTIKYLRHSFIVSGRLDIYLPNQLWYLAAICVPLYKELSLYKQALHDEVDISSYKGNKAKAEKVVNNLGYDGQERDLLVKFLSDYEWWRGGKSIDRGDYFYSPILSVCNLVNVSQSYVAEMCKYLASTDEATALLNQALLGLHDTSSESNKLLQTIYFGAPGSGKSHKVKDMVDGVPEENIFRTTFHPDSDYASFVGCYKPIVRAKDDTNLSKEELLQCFETLRSETESYPVDKFAARYHASLQNISKPEKKWLREELQNTAGISFDPYAQMNTAIAVGDYLAEQGLLHSDETITYDFSPQVFTNAYVRAWEVPSEHVYLIIEEINRGNCAQIFGDLFQLLDRDRFGVSEYKIKADEDLARYLQSKLGVTHEGIKGGNLCLPSNLHIIATMNTSDQSLFPMDSAFKRRWEWEYVPINYSDSPGIPSGEFTITIGCNKYRWIDFLEKVNEQIHQVTDSEDKQMGNFFIKRSVGEDEFKSKVMFYLWHEVCKDEFHTKNNFFRSTTKEGQEFSFNDLYKDGSTDLLKGFMDSLGVTPMPLASTSAVSDATSTGTTT
ncbi:AAA family ATPase [uncultured Porphyromonas sp.]|uniref:AAA family ATPase n=1 Tax=uncultured Porphyromonas sp. TaxID=159274 RepID=UPI0025F89A1B|nr:AAA family ATPase [uncultured Porphyromonas sp.]